MGPIDPNPAWLFFGMAVTALTYAAAATASRWYAAQEAARRVREMEWTMTETEDVLRQARDRARDAERRFHEFSANLDRFGVLTGVTVNSAEFLSPPVKPPEPVKWTPEKLAKVMADGTGRDLYRRCVETPTANMVFADWLEEHDEKDLADLVRTKGKLI